MFRHRLIRFIASRFSRASSIGFDFAGKIDKERKLCKREQHEQTEIKVHCSSLITTGSEGRGLKITVAVSGS